MDVQAKLDEIVGYVETAKSMPLSASAVVHRGELLAMLDELRALLPAELDEADRLLADRESLVAQGRAEAEQVVAAAEQARDRLVSDTEVIAEAHRRAELILADAAAEADRMRAETEGYVDGKLAHFEIALERTLETVRHGRDRLRERAEAAAEPYDEEPLPGA